MFAEIKLVFPPPNCHVVYKKEIGMVLDFRIFAYPILVSCGERNPHSCKKKKLAKGRGRSS